MDSNKNIKKIKIGILGMGDIFDSHYQAIIENENAILVAVCDLIKADIPNVNFYTDYMEMLDKEKLDVVHILTPHHLHHEHIMQIVQRKIHCLVEKPLVQKYSYVQQILDLLKVNSVKVGCVFQNRFNPTIVTLKKIIEDGTYGDICGIKGILTWNRTQDYYNSKEWRKDNGVLISQAIHTIDLIHYLGGKITSLRGSLFNITDLKIAVEDSAMLNFDFANGAKGLLIATNAYIENSSIELEVITEKATLTIKNNKLKLVDKAYNETILASDPLAANEKSYYGTSHKIIIDNFYESVINNTNQYIDVVDATISLKLIELARIASKKKQKLSLKNNE